MYLNIAALVVCSATCLVLGIGWIVGSVSPLDSTYLNPKALHVLITVTIWFAVVGVGMRVWKRRSRQRRTSAVPAHDANKGV